MDFGEVVTAPLSRTERLRILRAFYRLQIVQLIWGRLGCMLHHMTPDADRVNFRLFGLWELWEVQEFVSAGAFYQRFRAQMEDDWLGENSSDRRGAALSNRLRCCFEQFRGFVAQVRTADEEAWCKTMEKGSSLWPGPDAAGVEEESWACWFRYPLLSFTRRLGVPERHRFPISLKFGKDDISDMPFAWADSFRGNCGYNFWIVMKGASWRGKPTLGVWSRLGFVMWDVQRVEALKKASFLSHCQTGWALVGSSKTL